VREFVFSRDPIKEFVDFATRSSKYLKKFICIAHNAKAFDVQFILKYIVEKSGRTSGDFERDENYRYNDWTKFIDSSNYIPMRLSELPKVFGLQDTLGKGFFPHLFNVEQSKLYWSNTRHTILFARTNETRGTRAFYDLARGNVAFEFRF